MFLLRHDVRCSCATTAPAPGVIVTATANLSSWVGSWHHVAVTYDGRGGATASQGVTIYLDGVAVPVGREDDAGLRGDGRPCQSARHRSRQRTRGHQYAGALDELRLWNVVRTQPEIQAAIATELTGGKPGWPRIGASTKVLGTSVADDSAGSSLATLLNGTLWLTDGPLAPDVTAPQIANIVVSNITPTGATITFTTNEPTTGWISYVAGTACPCSEAFSGGLGLSHTITLTGLAADTTYQVEANAHDAANNAQAALPISFRTLQPSADLEPPVVSLDSPTGGLVAGSVQLHATASDNVAVTTVTFRVDGVVLGAAVLSAPYTLVWDSTSVADGAHTLTAEARDAVNHVTTATVVVLVQNTPVPNAPHYVAFDGVNDYVHVADAPALSFGNGTADTPLTIEAWVRPETVAGRQPIVGKSGEYRLMFFYGTIFVQLRDNSTGARVIVTANANLSSWVGSWHHVAVTYDGRGGAAASRGVSIYLDGAAVPVFRDDVAEYVAMEDHANPIEIGRDSELGDQYAGALDELRLWNVVRTQPEIQAAIATELTGGEAGLAAYWRFNEGLGTSVADDSAGSSLATLLNGTLWLTDGPLTPDVTAPQIANIVVSNITPTGATITFTTNEPTTGWISYVAGTACPCSEAFSGGLGLSHTITLTGLAADTTYQVEANAHDAANNAQAALPISFRTLQPSADLEPPVVSLDSPTGGLVAGSVQLHATASDNVAVTTVTFRVDGVVLGAAVLSAPYTLVWDSTSVADGAHTLTAEARDAVNHVTTATVVVLVQNTPVPNAPHYVAFDGVNDYVHVADAPALSFGNGTADTPLTIEAWVRPETVAGRQPIVGKSGEYRLMFFYGTIFVQLRDNSTGARVIVTANANLSSWVGSWHHVAVTYDGRGGAAASRGVSIYLDGAAVPVFRDDVAEYVAMEDHANPIEIGRDSDQGDQYAGALDELRLWNVVRTQPEIQAAIATELTGGEAGLAAYWRFNEGLGTSVADDSAGTSVATISRVALWMAGGPF